MTIDQRRYVDIASGVIGSTAAAMQKLDLRIMTTNPLVPSGSVLEFASALDVAEHFGAMSEEAGLASAYFSYVSPAPVSRARALQFAPHADSARDPSRLNLPDTTSITTEEDTWRLQVPLSNYYTTHMGRAGTGWLEAEMDIRALTLERYKLVASLSLGGIRGSRGAADVPGDRGDVHDRARPTQHRPDLGPEAAEHPGQVDSDYPVPVRVGVLVEPHRRAADAGDVDSRAQRPKILRGSHDRID